MRAKYLIGGTMVAATFLISTSISASAHTGTVSVGQNCQGGSASVVLNHNTTTDRSVDVVTTIPGTSGFVGHHYGSSFGEIWTASWPTPRAGHVTLNIYRSNGTLEFTESKTLQPVEDCVQPTTTSTTTIPVTTTTTEEPTSTTTIASTSTTSTTVPLPVESTTSTTIQTSSSSTVPAPPASSASTTTSPKRIVQIGTPTSIAAPPTDALPRTGSSSLPLAVGGFASALAGSLALALTRKKKARA